MADEQRAVPHRSWELPFLAEPEEVAVLRRSVRLRLVQWGLPHLIDVAQLCVGELVTNVIEHVGAGTPTVLLFSLRERCVRIEVRDPDARALPTLVAAGHDAEGGRGIALLDALAERWGVELKSESKVTWCELATGRGPQDGDSGSSDARRAEEVIHGYGGGRTSRNGEWSRLSTAVAEEVAIDVIADLLHWLRAHGCDPDEALDRAQMHFEAEMEEVECTRDQ